MSDDHKNDDAIKFFLVLGVVLMFTIIAWIYLHTQISSGVRWIRIGEMYLIGLFTDRLDLFRVQMTELRPENIAPRYLIDSTKEVMEYFKLPAAILLGLMAFISFFLKFDSKFTRRMGLENIIDEHAKLFPVITPITKFNPLTGGFRTLGTPVPAKMQPFAEALSPEEWVAFHAIPMPNNELDRVATRHAFLKQLGKRWRSPKQLPLHMQILFVACAMKANGMRKPSDDFLADVAQCWDPKRGMRLTSKLRKQLKQELDNPKTGRVMAKIALQHAFTTTAMLRVLQTAREQGGVLAPAQFIWLRAVDRDLWYPMNNLGRNATHAEAAGAIMHYRVERAANKPIPNPQLDGAVDGLATYLSVNGYTGPNAYSSIPPRDYRGEQKSSGARAPG